MSKWSDGAALLQKIITAKEVAPIHKDLINLQQTMFALQADQMRLVDENQKYKEEIKELRSEIKLEKTLEFDSNNYWIIKPDGSKDGPFCHYCKDVENRMVRKPKAYCSQCVAKKRYE